MTSRLDSRALELFLAVAETLSFRQAAETLHMTQPPLSRAIRELEERLGTRLFVRDTRGVALTEAGKTLLPYARQVARVLGEARSALAVQRGLGSPTALRLGVTTAMDLSWLQGLPHALKARGATVAVNFSSDTSPRLVQGVRAGRLDAAFIALPTQTRELEVIELDRQPLLVALASSHPLARRRALTLTDLANEPLFWFERARQPTFYDHCQRVFARHSHAPPRLKEPADHLALLGDVASAKGVALLPASFASLRRTGVSYRRLTEGEELAVGLGLVMPADQSAGRDLLLSAVADLRGRNLGTTPDG